MENEKQLEINNAKHRTKEELPSQSRRALVAPGDTIRSKIEDKLTEEKLIGKVRRMPTRPGRLRAQSG